MIIHIPHASTTIEDKFKDFFTLDDDALAAEKLLLVDLYTDDLFAYAPKDGNDSQELTGISIIEFKHCRLLVDVERFIDDDQEAMSKVGMGVIYDKTANGLPLKRSLDAQEREQLLELYREHHRTLTKAVANELAQSSSTTIVDCHSFPPTPLPVDQNQKEGRPGFCLGFDEFHATPELIEKLATLIKSNGYSVGFNEPYAGSLVPIEYYMKDPRVQSIMIEINRATYMDDVTGAKLPEYLTIKNMAFQLLKEIKEFQYAK